jgi:hypothetical protein
MLKKHWFSLNFLKLKGNFYTSRQCWGSGFAGSASLGLPDQDKLVRGTDPALDPSLFSVERTEIILAKWNFNTKF